MSNHYEETLQRDIGRIRNKVEAMAHLVEGALDACLPALVEMDRQTAYAVILRDRRIDELEKEIDRLCLEFILRQQPVSKHLRFAYTTIKVNQELERIGDYAESIARQILKISRLECSIPLDQFQHIASLSTLSTPMLRNAVRAYLTEDAELARSAMEVEDEVDALKSVINSELFQLRQENKIPLEALTPLMTIARRFERVSDQAKNICEETLYLVTGEYQKHLGGDVWRVVFIDEHNSCRSPMAEGIANALGQPQFVFASAGLDPRPVDAGTVAFLAGKGIDISRAKPRSLDQVPNVEYAQIIVALAKEAKKVFPSPTRAVCLDWSVADPSAVQGSAEEKQRAYEAAYQFMHEQLNDLMEAVLADKID